MANTRDGLAAARGSGRSGGRRPKLSAAQAGHAQQLYDTREHDAREQTVAQTAALLGVARTTVNGHLDRAASRRGAGPAARTGSPA